MKYLLIFTIVLVGLWLWRNNRRAERHDAAVKPPAGRRPPQIAATEIVACDVCHVHLPRSEALTGPGGVYCSESHRRQAGG